MKLSKDELIEIITDVTTLLGTALAQHVELTETLASEGTGTGVQAKKLETLKAKLADEKLKLKKLDDVEKRKRELRKANKHQA